MTETAPGQIFNLIDSHAHLTVEQFDTDREHVIKRAQENHVYAIVNVGTQIADCISGIELAERHNFIHAAVGIHPQECSDITEKDLQELAQMARHPRVVAIGEIGLDFHADYAPREHQLHVLRKQLLLADEVEKPVLIHARQSEIEIRNVLQEWIPTRANKYAPGVIHCFSGTLETAHSYLQMGFYISLGAYIGYPSSKAFREVIKQLPLEKLLVETDCPYLPPQRIRGQRNEPSYVADTVTELAHIHGISSEVVANHTTANSRQLFKI
ncbi:MAG: TatD family hydrolase [Dehalococcoidia bacterium]|jgi:TatD DNase family protein|nr:TatD family hydrolase [Dehalococcoidia bacterium]